MKVHHKKGRHYARWIDVIRVMWMALTNFQYITLTFTEESKYNLDRGDQMDWNKVIGRGGFLAKNGLRKNEDFIVWRYDAREDVFHVATGYKRRDYKMILPKNWNKVETGDSITVPLGFPMWPIPLGAYFGGNRTAPNDLTYSIKKL